MKPHDGPHDGDQPYRDPVTGELCFGCKVKTMMLGPEATASRDKNKVAPREHNPSWEAGIAGERRPGGAFMPYLKPNLALMGVKEAGERRTEIQRIRHAQRNDPGWGTKAKKE